MGKDGAQPRPERPFAAPRKPGDLAEHYQQDFLRQIVGVAASRTPNRASHVRSSG